MLWYSVADWSCEVDCAILKDRLVPFWNHLYVFLRMGDAILKECHELQESEVELLKAMYTKNELHHCDIPGSDSDPLFSIDLVLDGLPVELVVQLSSTYPVLIHPSVLVRCSAMDTQRLNGDLRDFIDSCNLGQPLIGIIIEWVQDNAQNYVKKRPEDIAGLPVNLNTDKWTRLSIYSHHLYSKTKRRNIEKWANLLNLKGFSCPGKPGIIIVEGLEKNCAEFWGTIHSWSWHRIIIKYREECEQNEVSGFLRFDGFCELILTSDDGCSGEMSELKKYLEDHNLAYIFPILFNL
ncbi:hypothetical protein AB6A40_004834 [Gnathostoma spinigerum]|uniref:RWD domain-containing protein n=1 Tax=Gnathostoma spinigerum TaxID=75299 RepID=A0ABD6EDP9_9BILA